MAFSKDVDGFIHTHVLFQEYIEKASGFASILRTLFGTSEVTSVVQLQRWFQTQHHLEAYHIQWNLP